MTTPWPVRLEPPFARDAFFPFDVPEGTPLVIDNGSYRCRAGWATDTSARFEFVNASARYRQRREGEPLFTVGGDINIADWSRLTYRTPFDGNVVCNFDSQELVLDHVLSHLNAGTDGRVDHPVIMTEAICNPSYCREGVSEILFECYSVPSVCYAADALCSTQIIPVVQPTMCDMSNSKRINLGGITITSYLMRMLNLKHPGLSRDITYGAYENLVHDHCYISSDYDNDISACTTRTGLAKIEHAIQLPFNMQQAVEKSAEERERIQQRRKEHAQRLAQLSMQRRAERVKAHEDQLAQYSELIDSKATMTRAEFLEQIQSFDFKTEVQLQEAVKVLQAKIKRSRNRQQGVEDNDDDKEPAKDKFDFSILNVQDADLTDEQIKEKRKLRLIKSGMEARERARQSKIAREKEKAEEALRDDQLRMNNFEAWKRNYMQRRQTILDCIRDRKRRREQLQDRKSAVSIQRMRSIAALASNKHEEKSSSNRKRRAVAPSNAEEEDTFGADDNDWLVYREISKEEDSDEEEEELTQLAELETALSKYDPDFDAESAEYGQDKGVLMAFQHGFGDGTTIAEQYQMHLNVERIRAPEILFQPWIAGVDQTGVVQSIQGILSAYSPSIQDQLCQNVYVTGGVTLTPGFEQRLLNELTQIRPFQSPIRVWRAADPLGDAWRGARQLATQPLLLSSSSITRRQYDEMGHDYLTEHALSNRRDSSRAL